MKLEAKNAVLRIAVNRTRDLHTWILQGRLAGRMVDELMAAWKNTRGERIGRRCVVDLVDVTRVDERGERALLEMIDEGVQFIARGVYIKGLLANLSE